MCKKCECGSNPQATPHKHAALIKAWADGATIEYREYPAAGWVVCQPTWAGEGEYRVKPATKSYGQIAYEARFPNGMPAWPNKNPLHAAAWEASAQAVLNAYRDSEGKA